MLLRLQRTEKQTSKSTVHVRGARNPVPEKNAIAQSVFPGTARRLPPLACSLPHWAPFSVSGTGISPIPRPLSIGVPAPASPGGPLPRSLACSFPFITQTLKATCCLSHLPPGLSPESGSTCPAPMATAAWLPSPPAASPSQHVEGPCVDLLRPTVLSAVTHSVSPAPTQRIQTSTTAPQAASGLGTWLCSAVFRLQLSQQSSPRIFPTEAPPCCSQAPGPPPLSEFEQLLKIGSPPTSL